jgi:opacity protein-like surface antigen
MLSIFSRRALTLTLLFGATAAAVKHAGAQAIPTMERGAEFAPFVQTTILNPDWGQTHNLGYTVGFDYTRFIPTLVQPSLEFRMTHASGRTVNQTTYLGGLKFQTTIHGVHPYGVVLAGKGIITFNYFYNGGLKGDDSAVYAYGGGAEFNVKRSWKLRAEYTQQHWNLDPNTLTPSAFGFGLAYSVPFHRRSVR